MNSRIVKASGDERFAWQAVCTCAAATESRQQPIGGRDGNHQEGSPGEEEPQGRQTAVNKRFSLPRSTRCPGVGHRGAQASGSMTMKRKTPERGVITLADLAPWQRVTGGSGRRVFGADAPIQAAEDEAIAGTKKASKDLPAKTNVKGGRLIGNDNVTLLRVA